MLGPPSTRRGAARAILGAGGSFARLLRAGQWHSSAYGLYLDLAFEETKAMASTLIVASDDEGPERRGRSGGEGIPLSPTRLGPAALSQQSGEVGPLALLPSV